jgi:hypothetical protein
MGEIILTLARRVVLWRIPRPRDQTGFSVCDSGMESVHTLKIALWISKISVIPIGTNSEQWIEKGISTTDA